MRPVLVKDTKLQIQPLAREEESEAFQRNTLTTAGVTPGIRMSMEKLEDEKSCGGLIPDTHSPGSGGTFPRDLVEERETADHGGKHHAGGLFLCPSWSNISQS